MQMRPRRSQEERKQETRRLLLDAATKLLIDKGMGAVTTTSICKAAGLSQGALFKHFETKHAMLCAVAAHLYDYIVAEFEASMDALPSRPGLDDTIEHLAAYFDTPQVRAVYDFPHARVDPELRETLQNASSAILKILQRARFDSCRNIPRTLSFPPCLYRHHVAPRVDRRRHGAPP